MFGKKLFKISLLAITLSSNLIFADWIEDLTSKIGAEARWDECAACEVISKYLKQDEENLKAIQEKIKNNTNNTGFWASVHGGAYHVELASVKSEKKFHEKLAKAFSEMVDNKKQREKFVTELVALHKNDQELNGLRARLNAAENMKEKIKIGALITAKKAEISGRKTLIRSSFLIS